MNIATFRPRQSTVLIRRIPFTKEDMGGIIIPGAEFGQYGFAEVIEVGPGNATVSHVGMLSDQREGEPVSDTDTRFMGDTSDLRKGDLIILKIGMKGDPLSRDPAARANRDFTLPFTVAGEKVELIGEGMIVAVITKE